jgi:hypothetical protein
MKNGKVVIQNINTKWFWACDEMPTTLWTPELSEAKEFDTISEAHEYLGTLDKADWEHAEPKFVDLL